MAINFYGSCNGSSASKYDIWINAKQNSQNVSENKSNVTIKLLLKRNDGYSASAYNLNAQENTVKLTVGGSVKIYKNISIDTRNGATVTLASWTGDVSHNADGGLTLNISGQFTMNGTSLSGGSVTGGFKLTSIPRASSASMDKSEINPGESVIFSINSASDGFTHKATLSLFDEKISGNASTGGRQITLTVPKNWASLITDSKSQYITVILATYNDGKKIGSKEYKLKLTIPATEEYLPDFSLSVERDNGDIAETVDEYIKNKSKVKISGSGVSLKYGATVASYSVKVGSLAAKTLPATFLLTESGAVQVSVTIKDSRGFSRKKTATMNVWDYKAPAVITERFYRCDENGNEKTDGTSLFAECRPVFSSVNGKNDAVLKVRYRKSGAQGWSSAEIFGGTGVLFKNALDYGSSYDVSFLVSDLINKGAVENIQPLSTSAIPFNIKKGGKGAAFGCYSEKDDELTVGWNLNVLGSLVREELPFSVDASVAENPSIATRFFPCLNICFLRIRVEAAAELNAGANHVIGRFSGAPKVFTPLSIGTPNNFSAVFRGGIRANDGSLFFNVSEKIPKGERIYFSGAFICDFENA